MKKKVAGLAFLALFFSMMLAGVATMPFIKQDGTAEKRILAKFPSLTNEDGRSNLLNFPSQFEDWLDDHIGLRMFWMQQYAELHAALGASVNDQVVVGQNGWLYFEPTVPDYTGVNALSENERWRVKYTLELMDRVLETPLVVFFAPNKNTVCAENMPVIYPVAEEQHAVEWLIENADVNIIDSISPLKHEELYYRTDTHWNARGARIGAGMIIESVNALTGAEGVAPNPDSAYVLEPYTGDLGQMLLPQNSPEDVQVVYEDAGENYDYVGRYRTPEDMTITTSGEGAPLSVLMLRDSFTNLLIEPISNAYSDVQYRRAMPLPLDDAGEYDVVVLEMVERRIGELLDAPPKLLAPETTGWESIQPNCTAEVFALKEKERVLLYGCVEGAVSQLTRLKVSVSAGGETKYYEAFPASGDETLTGDGCFSLYLSNIPADVEIQVCMEGNETLLSEESAISFVE